MYGRGAVESNVFIKLTKLLKDPLGATTHRGDRAAGEEQEQEGEAGQDLLLEH